jgi:hypothetical protein
MMAQRMCKRSSFGKFPLGIELLNILLEIYTHAPTPRSFLLNLTEWLYNSNILLQHEVFHGNTKIIRQNNIKEHNF